MSDNRVTMLNKFAEAEGITLPNDVAFYLAGQFLSSDIDLKGVVIRLAAFASLTGQSITLTLAHEVVNRMINPDADTPERVM